MLSFIHVICLLTLSFCEIDVTDPGKRTFVYSVTIYNYNQCFLSIYLQLTPCRKGNLQFNWGLPAMTLINTGSKGEIKKNHFMQLLHSFNCFFFFYKPPYYTYLSYKQLW